MILHPWRDGKPARGADASPARFLTFACVLCALVAGCSKDEPSKPKPLEEYLNPLPANANSRILSEYAFGDASKRTTIYALGVSGTGKYCFRGVSDGVTGAGVLNSSGTVTHFEHMLYDPRSICALSSTAPVPDAFIVVGARDLDSDGNSDRGYASLFSGAGILLDELVLGAGSSDVWINGIASVSDTTLALLGGERPAGTEEYPYLALVAVTPEPKLALRAHATIGYLAGRHFGREVAVVPPTSANELAFRVLTAEGTDGPVRIEAVHTTLPDLDPVVLDWNRQVTGPYGPTVTYYGLCQRAGDLFVCGRLTDNRKPLAADGDFWDSGFVASYARTGDLRWLTVVSVSQFNDHFQDACVRADALYAVGNCSEHVHSGTMVRAYGLITAIDPVSGAVTRNLILGQARHESGLNSILRARSDPADATGPLTLGGWTEYAAPGGPYRGWLSRVDVSAALPAVADRSEPSATTARADARPISTAGRGKDAGGSR